MTGADSAHGTQQSPPGQHGHNPHLYKLHRDPSLLLAASLPQPLIRHLGRRPQVDDEVEGQPDVGVHPVVPRHQHLQLRPAQGALLPRVLQEAESVILNTALYNLY